MNNKVLLAQCEHTNIHVITAKDAGNRLVTCSKGTPTTSLKQQCDLYSRGKKKRPTKDNLAKHCRNRGYSMQHSWSIIQMLAREHEKWREFATALQDITNILVRVTVYRSLFRDTNDLSDMLIYLSLCNSKPPLQLTQWKPLHKWLKPDEELTYGCFPYNLSGTKTKTS